MACTRFRCPCNRKPITSLTRGHDKMLPGCIRAIPSCSVQIVGQTGMATANKARQFKIDWVYGDVGLFHWYFA